MRFSRWLFSGICFFLVSNVFAIDPIAWTLNQSFPSTIFTVGGAYSIQYTLRNQLPLTLVKPLAIGKYASPAAEFSFNDQCTGKRLDSQASCTVTVSLDPETIGEKRMHIAIAGYDKNIVNLPEQVVTATGSTGVTIQASTITALPASMPVNTSATYRFRFTNTGTSTATGLLVQTTAPGYSSSCGNQLTAGSYCEISGNFSPSSTTPATQSVVASFSYNQGATVTASSSTIVTAATGLTGQVTQSLPGITTINTNYTVTFSFTNNEPGAVNINQNNIFPVTFTVNPIDNTCPDGGAAFASGASCSITGTFNSAATGNVTISAVLTPTVSPPPAVTLSTSTFVTANTAGRTINFVNQCDFNVWFSLNGANRQNNGNDIPCSQDSDCPAGSNCNPSAGAAGLCFWENFGPTDNTYLLTATGGNNTVVIPASTDPTIQWSGVFSASLGCAGSSCAQAQCQNNGGTTSCAPGVGFSQPATQAEITMLINSVDTYDVEVINGFHIPVQMTPSGAGVVANNYSCGSPGAPTSGNNFGACNWNNAVVPNTNYYWVGGGSGTSCSSGQACPGSELCGLNIGINKVCGDFLGFWTADEACAINSTNAQPYFGCNDYLGTPFPANTYRMSDLYSCKTPDASQPTLNSCYKVGATTACCGCANWETLSVIPAITLPPAPITENCLNANSTWTSIVQNSLLWMKQTCPTVYTYPFDDKSSTFTCQDSNTPNTVDYTVTFCPGGFTGLPTGATDGRS